MKKNTKLFSLLLTFIYLVGIFTGCTRATGTTGVSESDTKQQIEEGIHEITLPIVKEPITITYWIEMDASTAASMKNLSEHEVVKELERRTGINIKFLHPPAGQADEQLNLMVASGDLPDVIKHPFTIYRGGAVGAIEDGIIINMNEMIEKYAPNFTRMINSDIQSMKEAKSDNGTIVRFGGVFRPEQMWDFPTIGGVIRKDWLDGLGLDVPETIDDWYTVLSAFKKKGVISPLALERGIINEGYLVNAFASAYGTSLKRFSIEDGKVKFSAVQPGYKKLLTLLNKWYTEGLINVDFPTHNFEDNIKKMAVAGEAGAWFAHLSHIRVIKDLEGGKDPNFKLAPVPFPVLEKGQALKLGPTSYHLGSQCIFISAKSKHPVEIVKFHDYIYSPEGHELVTWGVEKGRTYDIVDGRHQFTDYITNNPDGLSYDIARRKYTLADMTGAWDWDLEEPQYSLHEQKKAVEVWKVPDTSGVMPAAMTMTQDEGRRYSTIMSEVETYVEEKFIKFVMGIEPLDKFDEFVAQVESMNIEEAINIQQAALDRYIAR